MNHDQRRGTAHHTYVPIVTALAWLTIAPIPAQILTGPTTTALPTPMPYSRALRVADLDGNGTTDAVFVGDGQSFAVFLGDGAGTFPSATVGTSGASLVSDVDLLDVDHDGNVDLTIAGVAYNHILHGNGLGGFAAGVPTNVGHRRIGCDWNGDGLLDLVATGPLAMAAGTAAGPLAPPVVLPVPAGILMPFGSFTLLAGDLDRDGAIDLVLGGGLGLTTILFGDGVGNVVGGYRIGPPSGVEVIRPRALVDLDRDGDLDLVAQSIYLATRIARNDGAGNFGPVELVTAPVADDLRAVDLDGDGAPELVGVSGSVVFVLRNDGAGSFGALEQHTVGGGSVLAVADCDGDGRTDVVAANATGLHLLRNANATPAGVTRYGMGTAACAGAIRGNASRGPQVGAADFRVLFANAPADAPGVLAFGLPAANGWTWRGLRFHLWFPMPVATLRSDAGGAASWSLPIPNVPALAGLTLRLQSFWVANAGRGDTCSVALHDLASSGGLSLTIQP